MEWWRQRVVLVRITAGGRTCADYSVISGIPERIPGRRCGKAARRKLAHCGRSSAWIADDVRLRVYVEQRLTTRIEAEESDGKAGLLELRRPEEAYAPASIESARETELAVQVAAVGVCRGIGRVVIARPTREPDRK